MTNEAHRSASATGLPSRRILVATFAAAPMLALPAAAKAGPTLARLIDRHRRAAAAHLAAIYAEDEVDRGASGDLLEIRLRQGSTHVEPDKISRAVVEKQVRDSYERARILAEGAHRLIKEDDLFAAQCRAADAAEAADLASVAAAYEAWPARRATAEAAERTARASDEEDAAMLAICSHRCSTVDEARMKAAYLLGQGGWAEEEPLHDHVIALLRSFAPEGAASA